MSDIKTVLRDIGGIFIIIGFVTILTLVVPIYYNETEFALIPIIITSAIYFGLGIPLYYFFKPAEQANFKTAMVTAALSWFTISVIGSLPFILIGFDKGLPYQGMDFLSAFFESMSGWTGTGLTMINNEEMLPYTLQFWRTLIQWVGGVGVVVLTLSILARPGTGSFVLYKGEARDQKTHPSIISTVRTIWWIFLLYTILGIFALILIGYLENNYFNQVGMNTWQAINHAMTGLATGGFSVTDDSISRFGIASKLTVIILMIFGSIAFAAHYNLLKGRVKIFFSDTQLKAMIIILSIGLIILTAINLKFFGNDIQMSFQESTFQIISAVTCTGFASVENLGSWSESAKLILSMVMVIGGAAGSTAGGIKLFRAILLYKGVGWRIKRAISTPRRVFVHKLGEKSLSKEDAIDLINEAAIISFMWIILLAIGIILILNVTGGNLADTVFEVCSAQGNVGLTTGITSINMSPIVKIMLICNMWIGRLEIIPIIVLVKSLFGIRKNII